MIPTKKIIKHLFPESLLRFHRNYLYKKMWKKNVNRQASDVFTEIYLKNLWGGAPGEYCSGIGSEGQPAENYCSIVIKFIQKHNIQSVIDIGCGDFRIGKKIAPFVKSYIGIDIVKEVIKYNTIKFSSNNISFQSLDATKDSLPIADMCLVRQVFQHLSNTEIMSILQKLTNYKYIIVTEHYPQKNKKFIANKDKPHGADTRVIYNSAVALNLAPFNIKPVELILSIPIFENSGDVLNTYLFNGNAIGNING